MVHFTTWPAQFMAYMALTWDMCPPVAVALGLGVGCLVASVTIFTCRFMNRFRDDDDSAVPFDDDVLDKDEEDDRDVPGVAEDDEVNAATSPDRPSKNLRSKAGSKKTTRKTGTTKRKASKSAPKRRRGKSLGAEAVEDEEEENDGEQQDYVREEDGEASYASTAAATTASGLTRATVTFSGVDDYSPAPTTRMTSPAAAYSSMIPDVPTMTTTGSASSAKSNRSNQSAASTNSAGSAGSSASRKSTTSNASNASNASQSATSASRSSNPLLAKYFRTAKRRASKTRK